MAFIQRHVNVDATLLRLHNVALTSLQRHAFYITLHQRRYTINVNATLYSGHMPAETFFTWCFSLDANIYL